MLHFIDDQHEVGLRLVDHLCQCLSQCRAVCITDVVELETKLESRCTRVNVVDTLEHLQRRRAWGLQFFKGFVDSVVHKGRRVGQRVTPEVDIHHQGACSLQGWDQVISQKRGFTRAAQSRQKKA